MSLGTSNSSRKTLFLQMYELNLNIFFSLFKKMLFSLNIQNKTIIFAQF